MPRQRVSAPSAPIPAPAAGPRDLAARHLGGHRIAARALPVPGGAPAVERLSHLLASTISRGTPKPSVVEQAERILREAVALLGGAAIPHRGFRIIPRNAAPGLEHETEIGLRRGLPRSASGMKTRDACM